MAATAAERAPAKVNLTLQVRERRLDGWHDLFSLVAFAGLSDLLTLDPEEPFGLDVSGPTASAAGPVDDNLVLKSARALAARMPGLRTGRFRLLKRLPVAAGIGGGSSDAAAALRLLARLNGLPADHPALAEAAAQTGADIPVCLVPRLRMMEGRGERVGPPLGAPTLFAVLVNPGVATPTPAVFAALGLSPGEQGPSPEAGSPGPLTDAAALVAAIAAGRNDLEVAAIRVAPVIADVLAALSATPGCALARMSGSGATCFALYPDCHAAARAARHLRARHPGWWIAPTLLR
jgi:4-diphosphocytidyl-2-C-methyl-D-erythritol kinase